MTNCRVMDEEKAAALDAAIDYEDAWLGQPATGNRLPTTELKGQTMLDKDVLLELDEAFAALRQAEDKVVSICARIAAGSPPAAGLAEARKTRAVRAVTVRRGPHVPRDPGQKNEPMKKVRCIRCSVVVGSRIVAGKRYPAAHYVPGTQAVCPGRAEVAELVARGAGGQ